MFTTDNVASAHKAAISCPNARRAHAYVWQLSSITRGPTFAIGRTPQGDQTRETCERHVCLFRLCLATLASIAR